MATRAKILVADDDRQVQRLVSMTLTRAGYEVINALDGYQAVQLTTEKHPDVLILDVHMPAGTGVSVQERIQNIGAHCATPIIYLTGDKSERVRLLAKRLGAFALIHKPFDGAELLKIVAAALGAVPSTSAHSADQTQRH